MEKLIAEDIIEIKVSICSSCRYEMSPDHKEFDGMKEWLDAIKWHNATMEKCSAENCESVYCRRCLTVYYDECVRFGNMRFCKSCSVEIIEFMKKKAQL